MGSRHLNQLLQIGYLMMKNKKKEVSISIQTIDAESLRGRVFLSEDERLQDMLNDERVFFPIEVLSNSGKQVQMRATEDSDYKLVLIRKDSIRKVEEL